MLRTCATLSVFGLLALAFAMALNSGGRTVSSLLPGTAAFEPMINSGTGQPLTLESVHKDVVWHRKTARDLRELDGVAGRTPKPTSDQSSCRCPPNPPPPARFRSSEHRR